MLPILDLHPGYLGNEHLLNESRLLERILAGEISQLEDESEYASLLPWAKFSWAAKRRYLWIISELGYRNVKIEPRGAKDWVILCPHAWPRSHYSPAAQLKWLERSGVGDDSSRIRLPENKQQLWAQHKYSILARNHNLYKLIGPRVANQAARSGYDELANELTYSLRLWPEKGGIRNALHHMWGHISPNNDIDPDFNAWSLSRLIKEITGQVQLKSEPYLNQSTALTEIQTYLSEPE